LVFLGSLVCETHVIDTSVPSYTSWLGLYVITGGPGMVITSDKLEQKQDIRLY